jgi:uncharacterized protein (UPF0333 family)
MTITKSQIITWSLLAAVAIIGIILLVRVFGGTKNPDDSAFKATIKAQDETIAVDKAYRETLEKMYIAHQKQDSMYVIAIQKNKPKYIINDKKLEDIPATVRDLSKDDLRRAATDY